MSGLFGGKTNNATQAQQAQGIRVQSSVYGRPLTIVYGTNRITGNLMWYGNFQAHAQKQSGGKGGGGSSTSYTYSAAVSIALCEGPILDIGQIWANSSEYSLLNGQTSYAQLGFTLFTGSYAQGTWSYLDTSDPSASFSYRGVAYVANPNLSLGSSPSLQNYSFEVAGLFAQFIGQDINAATIVEDVLQNLNYGAGWSPAWINANSLNGYWNYCQAMSFFYSPVYDSQTAVQQCIQDLLDSTNSTCWWSEGTLKIAPYADAPVSANGINYVPDVTPVYDLTDDHFLYKEGHDPIQISRTSPADAYNIVQVEYVARNSNYATVTAEAMDMYAVSLYGSRYDTVRTFHHICTQPQAQVVAQLWLQRNLYIRNAYSFSLGYAFCALEPMDLVTLTDPLMNLSRWPVRITGVEENDNGELTITAEDFPEGFATPAIYGGQPPIGQPINWNVAAPNPTQVVFYEPPGNLTNNQMVLWMGVAGLGNWSGGDIFVSVDGEIYTHVGQVHGAARIGVTTSALTTGSDPDTADVLGVDLTSSGGALASGSRSDADNYNTLCVVGAELISYENASLTDASKYNLSYLRRGAYGTAESAWPAGTAFMRCDSLVFSYPIDSSLIGKPVYVKVVSFNGYGGGQPSISAVPVYTYNVLGSAVNQAPADVTGVYTNFLSGITQLFWSPVVDPRAIDYEIRIGLTWGTALFVARTTSLAFAVTGNGTYWVAAHYRNPNGYDIYSDNPADIAISENMIAKNNIISWDEVATSWSGTFSGGASISAGDLTLAGSANILSATNVLTIANMIDYGGVAASGGYEIPAGHEIDIGYVTNATVKLNFTSYGVNLTDNILAVGNVLTATDLLDAAASLAITCTAQIAIATTSGAWGAWQNYQPGVYNGRYFKARLQLTSSNQNVTPIVSAFTFAVDVDVVVTNFTGQALASGGTTLPYGITYNAGPNGAALPNIQVSVVNAAQGDTVIRSGETLSQVTLQVLNGGVGVARTVDVAVTGY